MMVVVLALTNNVFYVGVTTRKWVQEKKIEKYTFGVTEGFKNMKFGKLLIRYQ